MSGSPWPSPAEIFDYYERVAEALRVLGHQFITVTVNPRSKFFGLLRDEFDDCLTRMREELDHQVVLMLIASAEATLRSDFKARLHRKTKDVIRPRFKVLRDQYGKRVALDDILDVWRDESAKSQRVSRFRQLVQRRNWLAHGRYWSDKSGVAPEPRQAQLIVDDLFQALASLTPGFPLS